MSGSGARPSRFDDLGTSIVVLESVERVTVELGVAKNDAIRSDERNAMPESCTGGIRQGVGRVAISPLGGNESCFAGQLVNRLLRDALVQSLINDQHHRNDEDRHDGK